MKVYPWDQGVKNWVDGHTNLGDSSPVPELGVPPAALMKEAAQPHAA